MKKRPFLTRNSPRRSCLFNGEMNGRFNTAMNSRLTLDEWPF